MEEGVSGVSQLYKFVTYKSHNKVDKDLLLCTQAGLDGGIRTHFVVVSCAPPPIYSH